ncbi:MAG: 7TM diverse intracellular signaling domain-containing protein, partial [Leptospirales bacterium]
MNGRPGKLSRGAFFSVLLLAFFSVGCQRSAASDSDGGQSIDLSGLPACARKGFEAAWTARPPPSGPRTEWCTGEWTLIAAGNHGSRPLGVRDLSLPVGSNSVHTGAAREYSVRIRFPAPVAAKREIFVPEDFALSLGSIGMNWEIYVNDVLLEREIHRDAAGEIRLKLYLRDHRVRIPAEILRPGENQLFVRLIAEPDFALSGIAIGQPQSIGPARAVENPLRDQIELALIILYLAAGAFHLLFFVLRPAERASLYFGLFALAIFLYFFSRGRAIYSITRDLEILIRLELICLYCMVPLFHFFIDTMLYGRRGRLARMNVWFHGALILSALALPIALAWDALQIWQLLALPFILYFLFQLLQGVRYEWIKQKVRRRTLSASRLLGFTLTRSVPGNLLLGYLILGAAAGYDVFDAVFLHRAEELTRYGFFVFIMGIAGALANRYIAAVHQVESLNEELRFRIVELNQANQGLRDSEERYRILVEESHDIIFTLDENFLFVRANRNMHRILGVSEQKLAGVSFLDLIY